MSTSMIAPHNLLLDTIHYIGLPILSQGLWTHTTVVERLLHTYRSKRNIAAKKIHKTHKLLHCWNHDRNSQKYLSLFPWASIGHNSRTRRGNPLLRLAIDSPWHVDAESTLIHGEQSNINKDMDHWPICTHMESQKTRKISLIFSFFCITQEVQGFHPM